MKIYFSKSHIYLFILFLTFFKVSAQNEMIIYDNFPTDQYSYLGGEKEFYKDFHKILIEKKLRPCENKKEFISIPVLVETDNTAEIIVSDSLISENRKCSFNLSKEVLKHMDKWIPAKIDGKPYRAVDKYLIFPDDLFEKYKEGYDFENAIIRPIYNNEKDGGLNSFRKEVLKRADLDMFYFKGRGKLTVETTFEINTKGELENLKILKSSGLKEYDEMIISSITRSSKKKWTPANFHGYVMSYRFRLPISVNVIKTD